MIDVKKITRAEHVIFTGLFVACVGLVWDLIHHYSSAVPEGLSEFFSVLPHDVAIAGFMITCTGALQLYRALREQP